MSYEYENEFDFEDEIDEEADVIPFNISLDSMLEYFNIVDKEALRERLTIISFFIAVFEQFSDQIISDVQSVFCMPLKLTYDGIIYDESELYNTEILQMKVGKKANGKPLYGRDDRLKASLLWYKKEGAISNNDFKALMQMRKLRNNYVHQMASYLIDIKKNTDSNYLKLRELIELYKKICRWFYLNVEAPRSAPLEIIERINNGEIKDDDISGPMIISLFETMADVLDL